MVHTNNHYSKQKKLRNSSIVRSIHQSPCICPKRNHLCSNDKLCLLNDVKQAFAQYVSLVGKEKENENLS